MIINNDTEHIKSRKYTKEIFFKLGPEAQTITTAVYVCYNKNFFNPIQSGMFQIKPPPPQPMSKTIVSIFIISYMSILLGVLGMFQLEFFFNLRS